MIKMSSDQINPIEGDLIRLRLEQIVSSDHETETDSDTETDSSDTESISFTKSESNSDAVKENVSSLDAYKKSLHCKNDEYPSAKEVDQGTTVAIRRLRNSL